MFGNSAMTDKSISHKVMQTAFSTLSLTFNFEWVDVTSIASGCQIDIMYCLR